MNKIIKIFLIIIVTVFSVNEIYASEKSVNVRSNPLGITRGVYNLNIDFKVSDQITVGPLLEYLNYDSYTTGFGVGAISNIYLSDNVFNDSWVIQPFVGMAFLNMDLIITNASVNGLVFGGLFGYRWHWDGGFNLGLGLGAEIASYSATINILGVPFTVSGAGATVVSELSFGYAFWDNKTTLQKAINSLQKLFV